ncbi:hypothetical protein GWA97_06545 [Flavobacterium sp. LaA7.5]|nr:hypothetical protein [Flavobacterium salilacus subsp. altitudinum]
MVSIVVVIFVGGCIIAFLVQEKNSSKEFYTKRISELEKEVSKLKGTETYLNKRVKNLVEQLDDLKENNKYEIEQPEPLNGVGVIDEIELQMHNNSMTMDDYNDIVNEIVKDAKYSPLERIYYESQLTDQIHDEVHLKQRVKEHLDYLLRKGVQNSDVFAAKEIIQRSVKPGIAPNFEDFILYTIKNKGKELTEEIYPGLLKMFEVAGYDVSKAETVYHKHLSF